MIKLRNKGSDAVSLYRPAGDPASLEVGPGEVVSIPGELIETDEQSDYLLSKGDDGEHRAWSRTRWEPVADKSPAYVPPSTMKDEG